MKVALVHDYLKEIGGAERVLVELKRLFPDAEVYTAFKFTQYWGAYREEMDKWQIHESWGRFLPGLPRLISIYVPISPWFFGAMDVSKYDLVIISATGAYFPNGVKVGPKTTVITYCHTPPRFLYGYPVATKIREKWYLKPISDVVNHVLRMVDFKLAQRPDGFVANSEEVARRIQKFYRRKATVIYPPVEGAKGQRSTGAKQDYYLMVTRIVGSKNIELAVMAANKYGFKLKVAGSKIGRSGDQIAAKITGQAEYLGEVTEDEKATLLAGARGVLCLEKASDFGMVAVEPQMYGVPVIAYRAGGYLESIKEGESGIFVERLDPEGIKEAVDKFEKHKWQPEKIKKWASRFGQDEFRQGILKVIGEYVGKKGHSLEPEMV